MKNKKGEVFGQLVSLALGIATLAIVLVVTFIVLAQGQTQIASATGVNCSTTSSMSVGCNATQTITNGVALIPSWIPLIVIAGIGAVLLGLVAVFRRN